MSAIEAPRGRIARDLPGYDVIRADRYSFTAPVIAET